MIRPEILSNNEIYHIFNRGVDKKPIFIDKKDYSHAIETLDYYRFLDPPTRFSYFLKTNSDEKAIFQRQLESHTKLVKIIAYCLMPNHYHLILKQNYENGISKFISLFQNSYAKFFNQRHERIGHLIQGSFKSVRVISNEQLLHLGRYIHLNPVNAFLIKSEDLSTYQWSSYPHYLGKQHMQLIESDIILNNFTDNNAYKLFVENTTKQQDIELIHHLTFDET